MDIVISFEKYIPKPSVYIGHFEMMKNMDLIEDVRVYKTKNGSLPRIEIIRKGMSPSKVPSQSRNNAEELFL